MPDGKGRGDGDIGSPTNKHIGYLEFTDDSGKIRFKPYLRSATGDIPQECNEQPERANVFGFRLPENGEVKNFHVRRYWLVRMCDNDNDEWARNEKSGHPGCDPKKPYIKVVEIKEFKDIDEQISKEDFASFISNKKDASESSGNLEDL